MYPPNAPRGGTGRSMGGRHRVLGRPEPRGRQGRAGRPAGRSRGAAVWAGAAVMTLLVAVSVYDIREIFRVAMARRLCAPDC